MKLFARRLRAGPVLLLAVLCCTAQGPERASSSVVVPAGTILNLALAQRTRLHRVGEALRAQLTDPIYVGNRLALPAGTVALGKVSRIRGPGLVTRAEAGLGGDFSPALQVSAVFDALALPDGARLPIATEPEPALPQLHMVAATGPVKQPGLIRRTEKAAEKTASGLVHFAEAQADWTTVKQEAVASLPYRPAALAAGTSFTVRLTAPVTLAVDGPAPLPVAATAIKLTPGLVLHARLETALSSATSRWGEAVRARVDRPVLAHSGRVLIPENALLLGQVTAAHPARRLGRGGDLHFSFSRLQFPSGASQAVQAGLAGAAAHQPLKVDSEGNVTTAAPKAAPELALGVVLFNSTIAGDADNAWTLNAGSGTHLRVWGTAVAMLIGHLRPLAMGLGYAGSARTIYSRFVARGQNIAFPKGTELIIRLAPAAHNGPALPLPHKRGH